ncbi:MAG: DUF2953 domain-containing protein [Hungatella hathewayi]|nr:DUF2953 domain-containing protein [Hungatella hathewayi]
MLHVGLLILKIIGFVLLGILCLVLGLLLIVLLVPVRYRMEGSWHGSLRGMARITWLLHILSVTVSYGEDGELLMAFRLFGFRLFRDKADGEAVLAEGLDDVGDAGEMMVHTAEVQGAREEGRSRGEKKVQEDPILEREAEPFVPEAPEEKPPADEADTKEGRISRFFGRLRQQLNRFLEKIKFLFHTLCDKLKHIKENYESVLTFVQDEENQKTMKLILRQVKALLRHILPRKASGYVVFGFDDPYTTGQVLAAASLFYAWYGQNIELIPMFEEPALEGELKLKGRIRMGTLLWCGLRVFLNKNFRVLLKRWRNMGIS